MKTFRFNGKLVNEERETVLVYDNIYKKWIADTTIPKHIRKFIKMGWIQVSECVDNEGNVIGAGFEAPARAITIRGLEKKQVSETQAQNLFKQY